MALIDCPECSHKISDQSISCPSCGFVTSKINAKKADSYSKPANSGQNYRSRKNKSSQGTVITIIKRVLLIIVLIVLLPVIVIIITSYSSYKERSEAYMQEKQESSDSATSLTPIPMLIAGAGEDGRYFLISHNTANSLENIEYLRKGKESDTYGKMQINCSNNKIRKNSTDSAAALDMLDLREWYTPDPNWTDKDIFNFICK